MTDQQRVSEFLSTQNYMVLAVVLPDGMPWATPVRIQMHHGNVFEWDSALQTEHSKALEQHPDMAITLFQKFEDTQIGVYAKGRGELVEEFKPGFGRYRFTATNIWINDETFRKREVTL